MLCFWPWLTQGPTQDAAAAKQATPLQANAHKSNKLVSTTPSAERAERNNYETMKTMAWHPEEGLIRATHRIRRCPASPAKS